MIKSIGLNVNDLLLEEARKNLYTFKDKTSLNKPTGDFFYEPWIIKDEYKDSIWDKILNTLKFQHGEARIIVLDPATCYQSHADIDDRYHLNIQGEMSYFIDLDENVNYKIYNDGIWYEMNAGKLHSAANLGRIPRAQLVVRKLLRKNIIETPLRIKISSNLSPDDSRFVFDQQASKWLNQANKSRKITDFKFINDTVEVTVEKKFVDELISILDHDFIVDIK